MLDNFHLDTQTAFEYLAKYLVFMGARRNFSRGGQSHRHYKKSTRFPRAVQKIDHFRRADENFCVFFFRAVLD